MGYMHSAGELVKALVGLMLLVFSGTLLAESTFLRLGIMPSSRHFDRRTEYNERHQGIFAEYRMSDSTWIGAMDYNNSNYNRSQAAYWLKEYDLSENVKAGWLLGAVTGYLDRPMAYGALTLTYSFGRAAVRAAVIPTTVVGFQAYYEF